MPCYRCGVRQTDPVRGESPWRRGVLADHLVLICPACQAVGDWTADLSRCGRCASAHLIRRLDQVECLDCGLVRASEGAVGSGAASGSASGSVRAADRTGVGVGEFPSSGGPDAALADEVRRAIERVLTPVRSSSP
jgi:hypothetical protein